MCGVVPQEVCGLLLFCLCHWIPWGNGGRYWAEAVDVELFTSPAWQGQEADADCNDSSEYVGYMCPKMLVLRKSRGNSKGQRVRHVLDPSVECPKLSPATVSILEKRLKKARS